MPAARFWAIEDETVSFGDLASGDPKTSCARSSAGFAVVYAVLRCTRGRATADLAKPFREPTARPRPPEGQKRRRAAVRARVTLVWAVNFRRLPPDDAVTSSDRPCTASRRPT
jgi:hypothetical protein